jgi:hypothetical protein
MAASGRERPIAPHNGYVRFLPDSGHFAIQAVTTAFDPFPPFVDSVDLS